MFENEQNENGFNNEQGNENNDYNPMNDRENNAEDIFAEEDVTIPNMEDVSQAQPEVGNASQAQPEVDYAAQSRNESQEAEQSSVYRRAQSEIPYARFEENAQSAGNGGANSYGNAESDAARQASGQSNSSREQYSYIPNDPQPKQNQRGERRASNQERRQKKQMNNYAKAIACAIVCGLIIGGCIIGSFAIGKNMTSGSDNSASVATTEENLSEADETSSEMEATQTSSSSGTYTVAQIADNCGSSVVAITNKSVSEVQTFFGVYEQESEGSGSGVIVSKSDTELLIVTNYHVIKDAEELSVCFNDSADAVYTAQVKGTDSDNDLAVVSVALSDMSEDVLNSISIATMGDSESLEVGDSVVAIGNALGLGQSVTTGIISALDREVTLSSDDSSVSSDSGSTATLLQTDAAINPGNSGGALFNMNGELIGINSAKYASTEVEGMGFAIPMATAKPIIEELMTKETRTKLTENYGFLNIAGQSVSSDEAEKYGVPEGVYVSSVTEDGAADKAGVEVGDIITSIGGTSVDSIEDLQNELQYYAAGETVEIVIQRNGGSGYEEQTLNVTLDNASEQSTSSTGSSSDSSQNSQSSGGSEYYYNNGSGSYFNYGGSGNGGY